MTTPKKWRNPDGTPMKCREAGCDSDVKVKGLCGSHYYHQRKDPNVRIQRGWYDEDGNRLPCMQLGCDAPVDARGLCSLHYRRNLSSRPPGEPRDSRGKWFNPDGTRMSCSEEGCDSPVLSVGLCGLHYDRAHKRKMGLNARPESNCPVPLCGRKKLENALICGRCRQARWRYGLSDEAYLEMMSPGRRICSNSGCGSLENLHIDHNHACCPTGKFEKSSRVSCGDCVRGWLCRSCNLALGYLKDSPGRMRGLLAYLEGAKSPSST